MKINSFALILLLMTITCTSCFDAKKKKLILGEWVGVEWISGSSPIPVNPQDAKFTFRDNGEYSLQFEGNVEKGKYAYANNQLFTTPEGGIRMMVKIEKLTQDTLIFNMNRGGQPEKLTLVRSN